MTDATVVTITGTPGVGAVAFTRPKNSMLAQERSRWRQLPQNETIYHAISFIYRHNPNMHFVSFYPLSLFKQCGVWCCPEPPSATKWINICELKCRSCRKQLLHTTQLPLFTYDVKIFPINISSINSYFLHLRSNEMNPPFSTAEKILLLIRLTCLSKIPSLEHLSSL